MDAVDPFPLELAAVVATRRHEALLPELMALRVLRAELARARPGLVREAIDGWRSPAASRFGESMHDVAVLLDLAELDLREAELALERECDRLLGEAESARRRARALAEAAVATRGATWGR